jgi:hypothetical protein
MKLSSLKSLLWQMQLAHASLDCSRVHILDPVELQEVARICSRTTFAACGHQSRIVATRLFLDEEDLDIAAREMQDQEVYCFSSQAAFSWSGSGPSHGSKLIASLGFRKGSNVLEVSSSTKLAKLSLSIDLHLVSPSWPKALSALGIKTRVNSSFPRFSIPNLDISDKRTRQTLACEDGVFCVLVLNSAASTAVHAVDAPQSKFNSCNALALELPKRPLRFATRGRV